MNELSFKPPYDFVEGACLLFDKPYEWTSFQLVKKIKYQTRSKVGHAGTLDPLATGLMILCTGKYTKKLQLLTGLDKSYIATIKIGATTPSFDRETLEESIQSINHVSADEILVVAQNFIGVQKQVPPMYSAIKKDGKKLYELARKGKEIHREPRDIEITNCEVLSIDLPFITLAIDCSKGTYIRALANDFGNALGVGGYLHDLRRTRIGQYTLEEAWQLDDFIAHSKQ